MGKPTSTLKTKSIATNAIDPTTLGICRGMIPPPPQIHETIPAKFLENSTAMRCNCGYGDIFKNSAYKSPAKTALNERAKFMTSYDEDQCGRLRD